MARLTRFFPSFVPQIVILAISFCKLCGCLLVKDYGVHQFSWQQVLPIISNFIYLLIQFVLYGVVTLER
jgi:hypothetical protein